MRQGRYKVTTTPDQQRWVILDKELWGDCALPSDDGSDPVPLIWRTRQGAEAWLHRCYMAWEAGRVPAPQGWRPFSPEPSPWTVDPTDHVVI